MQAVGIEAIITRPRLFALIEQRLIGQLWGPRRKTAERKTAGRKTPGRKKLGRKPAG